MRKFILQTAPYDIENIIYNSKYVSRMKFLVTSLFTVLTFKASCCITCNKDVQLGIRNSTFYPNLAIMLSAFIVLAIIVWVLAWMSGRKYRMPIMHSDQEAVNSPVPLWTSALVLGIGLGGFADGIVLHQILQWHAMLSHKLPPSSWETKTINMFWDGIFHLFTWAVTITGLIMLWRTSKRYGVGHSGLVLFGGMLQGWGLFNIVEGVINHHLLGLHMVNEYSPDTDLWNFGFLAASVLLILAGWTIVRSGRRKTPDRPLV